MTRCCIFDLDGTLLDTVESLAYSANRALEKYGLQPHAPEKYRYFAGDGQLELIKRSVIASGDTMLEHYYDVLNEYIRLFAKDCIYKVKPYDGITDVLDELKRRGIKIAVLTNKQHENAVSVLDNIFGTDYFDLVLGQDNTHEKKPSPTGVMLILSKLQVNTDECLYFGDTNTDMKTGSNAGVHTVGVTWGFREREELEKGKPENIIDRPEQLLELL